MSTTLTDARSIVRQFARSGGSSTAFDNTQVDNAIKIAGKYFVRETRVVTTKTTVVITADTDAVSFTALTGFRPGLLVRARVTVDSNYTDQDTKDGVERVDYDDILRMRGKSDRTDVPEFIGFSSFTAAEVYPTPEFTGTLTVWWAEPFTTFTAGTASPNAVTLNIPDDLVDEVMLFGASAILQLTDPEAVNAALRTGAFKDLVERCRGIGSLTGASSLGDSEEC